MIPSLDWLARSTNLDLFAACARSGSDASAVRRRGKRMVRTDQLKQSRSFILSRPSCSQPAAWTGRDTSTSAVTTDFDPGAPGEGSA